MVILYYYDCMMIDVILFLFLICSIYTDIAQRRIYNATVFPIMAVGVMLNVFYSGAGGLKDSAGGIAGGFLFLCLFYLSGGMGAGDVKFMMAVGALKGFSFMAVGGLYGALVGGIAALCVLIIKRQALATVKDIGARLFAFSLLRDKRLLQFDESKAEKLPYAAFLSCGMLLHFYELYFL